MKTSKDPRHQARKLALGIVYSIESYDYKKYNLDELISNTVQDYEVQNYDKNLLDQILQGVKQSKKELKEIISKNSKDWDVDKMYRIDLSILLISVWEILNTQTPVKVAVDEAVELAKEFGEAESAKFVNGVLAGVIKSYGKQ